LMGRLVFSQIKKSCPFRASCSSVSPATHDAPGGGQGGGSLLVHDVRDLTLATKVDGRYRATFGHEAPALRLSARSQFPASSYLADADDARPLPFQYTLSGGSRKPEGRRRLPG
jgi:hypothetical protein